MQPSGISGGCWLPLATANTGGVTPYMTAASSGGAGCHTAPADGACATSPLVTAGLGRVIHAVKQPLVFFAAERVYMYMPGSPSVGCYSFWAEYIRAKRSPL
jgi:hypothetical protein